MGSLSTATDLELDALIVGAGFSGLSMLHKLRKSGFTVKVYEAGGDLGGTWFWTRYPGARADCEVPLYQLQFADADAHGNSLWTDFEWSERFPGRDEMMRYFHHVDNKLEFSKDIQFNTRVVSAQFDDSRNGWLVKSESENGTNLKAPFVWARHLILATGGCAKSYTPHFDGLESFKGDVFHSAQWPESKVDLNGKRVAILGTGASGVQIIQDIGPVIDHLTVYQRTPNMAIPMRQYWRDNATYGLHTNARWEFPDPETFARLYNKARDTWGGDEYDALPTSFNDATPEEREALFESLWAAGGLRFWDGGYKDSKSNEEANVAAYDFWLKKVRPRITDHKKRELLAPLEPPHAWGTKQPCLEQTFYEVFNQPNVDIINLKESPIVRIAPEGIETEKEGVIPVDTIIFATGYDFLTGTILNIDIRNEMGQSVQEKWDSGVRTLFGLATRDFPNLYFTYGPQSPSVFANGPTCIEMQTEWLTQLMEYMRSECKNRVEPGQDSEDRWAEIVHERWNESLMPGTDSWYQGSNIPGKRREVLAYFGRLSSYDQALKECACNNYAGFVLT